MIIDIILALALGYAVWHGYREGVVKALVGLVSLVGSLWLTTLLYHPVANWIVRVTGWNAVFCRWLTLLLLVILLYRGLVFLGYLADRSLRFITGLPIVRTLNGALGALFRFLQTLTLIAVIIVVQNRWQVSAVVANAIAHSYVSGLVVRIVRFLWPSVLAVLSR